MTNILEKLVLSKHVLYIKENEINDNLYIRGSKEILIMFIDIQ